MLTHILIIAVGLVLLVFGAELLVRGASSVARALRVPDLVIGLTVVAFGTSTPELAVNLSSAVTGNGDIGFGNVIGSNICNIGLILGLSALIRSLDIHVGVIVREIPMMLLTCLVALAMAFDIFLDDHTPDAFGRSDGIVLLLFFCVFLYYTLADARANRTEILDSDAKPLSLPLALGMILLGLAALVGGGKLTVDSAVQLAEALNAPPVVVGLLLVAVGTSLPELATSTVAAYRGMTDIAIGNVVGSNIFNLLFIMGISSTVTPVNIPEGGHLDLLVMIGLSALLIPLCATHKRRLVRWEGALLLGLYAGYCAWRLL